MRTFIALDLSNSIKEALASIQEKLRPPCKDVRWVDVGQIHLTLRFLGEIDPEIAPAISETLEKSLVQIPAFTVEIAGVGVFNEHGPVRVIWTGIVDRSGGVARCYETVGQALSEWGYPAEDKPFVPHITLGRNRNPRSSRQIRQAIEEERLSTFGIQTFKQVTFYESVQVKGGHAHQALSRHLLSKAHD